MKTLLLDIENRPNLAWIWSLFKEYVDPNRLVEPKRTICFAAKWLEEPGVKFWSEYEDGRAAMVMAAQSLLSQADVVVTYNGNRHDLPALNREILTQRLTPPAPYKSVDLFRVVKRVFDFPSMKLDYVARELGLARKAETGGFELWERCIAGDPEAWAQMERYNVQDVRVLEELYYRLRAWTPALPAVTLYDGTDGERCPACNGTEIVRKGFAYTDLGKFQQYHCKDPSCGRWFRSGKRVAGIDLRPVAAGK